jgi:protein archease
VYRWLEHTAELGLLIEAASDEDVFREALAAFTELIGDGDTRERERLDVPVALRAATVADLLVAWLEELVFLADTERLVPDEAHELRLEAGEPELRAIVRGSRGAPRPIVKAVTYHGLEFAREGGRSRAHVVFDV